VIFGPRSIRRQWFSNAAVDVVPLRIFSGNVFKILRFCRSRPDAKAPADREFIWRATRNNFHSRRETAGFRRRGSASVANLLKI